MSSRTLADNSNIMSASAFNAEIFQFCSASPQKTAYPARLWSNNMLLTDGFFTSFCSPMSFSSIQEAARVFSASYPREGMTVQKKRERSVKSFHLSKQTSETLEEKKKTTSFLVIIILYTIQFTCFKCTIEKI